MEEVYIIKLKGLPVNPDSSQVSKKPSIYANDLSVEVLYGFGLFQVVIGLITILFGLITVTSDEWKLTATGVGSGTIFISTGFIGIWSSFQRKDHFLTSNIAVRIFLVSSTLSLIVGVTCVLLMVFGFLDIDTDQLINAKLSDSESAERRTITDYDGEIIDPNLRGDHKNEIIDVSEVHPHVKTNIFISLIVDIILSLFSMFTTCRILWPNSLKSFGGVNWPTRPEVRKKIIVKTSIHASSAANGGMYQAADFCRALGPNCVVSLSPPKSFNSPCQQQQLVNQQSSQQQQSGHRLSLRRGDSVSLASYDDDDEDISEFGHEVEREFVSRTNSSTSNLLPAASPLKSTVGNSVANCNGESFKEVNERVMSQEKRITDMNNGVVSTDGGNQGNWDHHGNHQQELALKLKSSVKQEVEKTNSRKNKKRIPAPKQPPPPPPPPPSSTLPPLHVVNEQKMDQVFNSSSPATAQTKSVATPKVIVSKVDSPGHCVQNGNHVYGGDHNGNDCSSATDDGAPQTAASLPSVTDGAKKIESVKKDGNNVVDVFNGEEPKDENMKQKMSERTEKEDKTSDRFIHFMNGHDMKTVTSGSPSLTVAQQLSLHLNRLKLNKLNKEQTMNGQPVNHSQEQDLNGDSSSGDSSSRDGNNINCEEKDGLNNSKSLSNNVHHPNLNVLGSKLS